MREFRLQIVTPDGLLFDGQAERLIVRSVAGDVGILAGHTDYVTALGMGTARIITQGQERTAACIGGMLSVSHGEVKVVATTFEWSEDIDKTRAEKSAERAKTILEEKSSHTVEEVALAEARLKRALVRMGAAK